MNFGQLLPEDAGEARKQFKRLVSITIKVTQASEANPLDGPLRLNIVTVKADGTETHALLDTGAVLNLISWYLLQKTRIRPYDYGF